MTPSLRLLLAALMAWGFVALLAGWGSRSAGASPDEGCDGVPGRCLLDHGGTRAEGVVEGWTPPQVEGAQVCPEAGYLCAGLAERGSRRVLRWNDGTQEISVRVPRPRGEDGARARALQRAAARGIRAWQGRPFPLRVTMSDRPGDHDVVVRWARVLGAVELGEARTEWTRAGGESHLRVVEFSLATRNPYDANRSLDPEQVELTAAHEMGHALGLPHSDDERDVMFPTNTATRMTRRDFLTMQALYEIENGAEIVGGR